MVETEEQRESHKKEERRKREVTMASKKTQIKQNEN